MLSLFLGAFQRLLCGGGAAEEAERRKIPESLGGARPDEPGRGERTNKSLPNDHVKELVMMRSSKYNEEEL